MTILFILIAQCSSLDIILLLDYSGSVHNNEDFVITAASAFVKQSDAKIGIISFNDDQKVVSELTTDKARLLLALTNMKQKNATGGTNIEGALQSAANELLKDERDRKKIVILISDGEITSGGSETQTFFVADQMRTIGITICSILIISGSSDAEFMHILSNGCYVESNYENLIQELKNLNICL